jgi:phosphoglucosamine mutase
MSRLFGTDGVRGEANRDLTPDLVLALARAAGEVLAPQGGAVVVGRDTRLSGPMLESALVAGLCSSGVDVRIAGVIPTPGVAFLTMDEGAVAGAVISASHNPVSDNGIKFFSDEGLKLAGSVEEKIEERMAGAPGELPVGGAVGSSEPLSGAEDRYVTHLLGAVDGSLTGLRVVLDCAFGAAWQVAPRTFREAGADVLAINAEPDGARINVDCGSTSLGGLSRRVVQGGADLGFAFDGDADRVLAVDERGQPVDGDRIIAMLSAAMHGRGELDNGIVVVTVMANLGLVRALEERGIEVVTAPVGDKFVGEAMAQHGAALGGEQSGHIIFARHSSTGDGTLTALKVAELAAAANAPLSQLSGELHLFPQELINVPVGRKEELEHLEELWQEVRRAEEGLGTDGRVLVRASGTEPVVRVMVEARRQERAHRTAEAVADAVRRYLG